MQIVILAACDLNHVMGRNGQLPWRLSADLQQFKHTTWGHVIAMGRKTFESIGRLLPGRTTWVLTRQPHWHFPGVHVAHSWPQLLAEATQQASHQGRFYIVGGAELYELALPHADSLQLTRVLAQVEGDTFFPEIPESTWTCVSRYSFPADARNEFPYAFERWERHSGPLGRP